MWGAWSAAVALVVVGAIESLPSAVDALGFLTGLAGAFAAISLVTSGAVLVHRVNHNPIGPLMWLGGLLLSFSFGSEILLPGDRAIASMIVLLSNVAWVPAVALIGLFAPLLFPTGRLPSPRWGAIVVVAVVGMALAMAQAALSPFEQDPRSGLVNPLAATGGLTDVVNFSGFLGTVAGVLCFPAVAVSLLVRYRRATGIERRQIEWFAAAAMLTATTFAIAIAVPNLSDDPAATAVSAIAWLLAFTGFGLLPMAIMVAVLRYRLYEIDVILRRTAVYIPLTAILAGVYAASTALLQKLFIAATGNTSDGAVILSTLILATLFTPIRTSLQSWVDRTFGDTRDADQALGRFVDAIAQSTSIPAPERVLIAFFRIAVEVTRAGGGVAYAEEVGHERLLIATARRVAGPTTVVAVTPPGAVHGRLELDARADGRPLNARDVAALSAAADRLGAALVPVPSIIVGEGPPGQAASQGGFETGD